MRKFRPSATNAVNVEMNRMRKEGIRVYNLGSGDPIVPNHPAVRRELEKAAKENMSPYAPVGGLLELRDAASEWMNRRYGSQYRIEHTMVACGGKFALFAALEALLDPGEEVLFGAPYWPSYPDIVTLAGGAPKAIRVNPKNDWKLTPDDLKKHLTAKSRVFLFNNGNNPTGALYSKKEVAALLEMACNAGLYVISDEVYSELVYDGAKFISCATFPEWKSHIVIVESCSKNFAMAGYRVGFAFAETPIIQNMIAVQSQTTTGTSFLSQRAAVAVLSHFEEAACLVREVIDRRRKLFFQTYNELFGTSFKPVASALYFFTKIQGSCEEILTKAHVAVVPGEAFGLDGYARLSFSETEEEIVAGLKSLSDII